jgi:acyl carrier protein
MPDPKDWSESTMVFEKIKEALAEQFDADPSTITKETDLMNDLGADSLDLVELIMTLEEEYGISATDESVYEHRTVGEISDYIESLVK